MQFATGKKEKTGKEYRALTLGEEIFNSITHGIGTLLSIAALVLLVVFAAIKGDAWHVVSFSISLFTERIFFSMVFFFF